MLLKKFCAVRGDAFHSQRLRHVLHRGIKIANLGIRHGERVDHVFILPDHDAARSLGIFDRLLTVSQRCVRAGSTKPGTIA